MKRIAVISLVVVSFMIGALVAVVVTTRMLGGVSAPQPQEERVQEGRKRTPKTQNKRDFRVRQIEKVLRLDEARAERFRELYAEYLTATSRREGRRSPFGREADMESMSDEQIESSILQSYADAAKMIGVKSLYYSKFREFLSAREVAAMYEIERRVNERFKEEIRRRESRAQREKKEI